MNKGLTRECQGHPNPGFAVIPINLGLKRQRSRDLFEGKNTIDTITL